MKKMVLSSLDQDQIKTEIELKSGGSIEMAVIFKKAKPVLKAKTPTKKTNKKIVKNIIKKTIKKMAKK